MKTQTLKQTQQIPQNVFNQYIELLIMYKKNNLEKEVSLSLKSLKDATDWFNTMKDTMMNRLSKEDIKEATDKLVENGIQKKTIEKALNIST